MRGENTCGYDSCPCRGVHFVSSYSGSVDYCVNGKRVKLSDSSNVLTPSATEEQVLKLEIYLLEEYARFIKWRAERAWAKERPLGPISWTLPLKRYQRA